MLDTFLLLLFIMFRLFLEAEAELFPTELFPGSAGGGGSTGCGPSPPPVPPGVNSSVPPVVGSPPGTIGGSVGGSIGGSVGGSIGGTVGGSIGGTVGGSIGGTVGGPIGGPIGGYIGGPVGGTVSPVGVPPPGPLVGPKRAINSETILDIPSWMLGKSVRSTDCPIPLNSSPSSLLQSFSHSGSGRGTAVPIIVPTALPTCSPISANNLFSLLPPFLNFPLKVFPHFFLHVIPNLGHVPFMKVILFTLLMLNL